jgi:hypothetical protein
MPDVNQQVIFYASSNKGKKVKRGECWDLAQQALKSAGAKASDEYGKVTATADYVWGTPITLGSARAGDIIQFKNYEVEIKFKLTKPDGSAYNGFVTLGAPHHTAIVESVGANGEIMVWEQNTAEFPTDLMELVKLAIAKKLPSKVSKKVHKNLLYFSNRPTVKASEGATSVEASITVSGQFIFYRPQPKAAAVAP